jgi:hypothetical protein
LIVSPSTILTTRARCRSVPVVLQRAGGAAAAAAGVGVARAGQRLAADPVTVGVLDALASDR